MNNTFPFSVISIPLLIYNVGIYYWKKKRIWQLNEVQSKIFKISHYISLVTFLILIVLNFSFDVRPRGISTTKGILIIMVIAGLLYSLSGDKLRLIKIETIYFKFWLLIPTISMILFIIMPWKFDKLLDRILNPVSYIYYEDSHYRVQNTYDGFFQPVRVETIEKKLFYERKIKASFIGQINHEKNLKTDYYLIFYDELNNETKRILLDKIRSNTFS